MAKKPKVEKVDIADQIHAQIVEIAGSATPDDRNYVARLVAKAKEGRPSVERHSFTPAVCAILFLENNAYNRDWKAEGEKSCLEYKRRMTEGEWKWNNASIGFYPDANIADGQHRLSGAAVAGFTLDTAVVFGIERDAIATIDDGKDRQASDTAKLEGITDPKQKQVIIKHATAYLIKAGDKTAKLWSVVDIKSAIKRNNILLEDAIKIGDLSRQNIVDPVLNKTQAQTLAYLMLSSGWPANLIQEKLVIFQSGLSTESEKTPYFVAGEVIKSSRKKAENKDRLTAIKELGVVIYAMAQAERGVRAVTASAIRGAVRKDVPNPAYPSNPAPIVSLPPIPVVPVPSQQQSSHVSA